MPIEVVVGLAGIFGVVVGGLIQFIAGSRIEKWKYTTQIQTESYKMLLRAITGVIYAQRANDKPSELEHLMMMAEAKAQMALYGSKGVLKATARFFRDHSGINDDESARAFTEIAIAMRKDSFASDYVGFRDDYSALLLGDKK